MLALDSNRWSLLAHAYGDAADIPDLLRRIAGSPTDADWSDLCGKLCHQGDVSSAAYAAVPHIVQSAHNRAPHTQVMHWVFVGSVARHGITGQLDTDIVETYAEAIANARGAVTQLLSSNEFEANDAIYLLGALAGLHGRRGPAWALEGLVDKELTLDCPSCGSCIYIWPDGQEFAAWVEDPVLGRHGPHTSIEEAPDPMSADLSSNYPDNEYAFLYTAAGTQRDDNVRRGLRNYYGRVTCPRCSKCFRLSSELERQIPSANPSERE